MFCYEATQEIIFWLRGINDNVNCLSALFTSRQYPVFACLSLPCLWIGRQIRGSNLSQLFQSGCHLLPWTAGAMLRRRLFQNGYMHLYFSIF